MEFIFMNYRVWGLLLCLFCGCTSNQEVRLLGGGFGLEKHGSELPHAPSIVSLVRTNRNGGWKTVWHAISFRGGLPCVLNETVLFGGATDRTQVAQGRLRLLCFSDETGVVDITEELAGRRGITNRISATFIDMDKVNELLTVSVQGDVDFKSAVTLVDIKIMIREVKMRNRKRKFDEIEIYE